MRKRDGVAHHHAFDLTSRLSDIMDEAGVSADDLLTDNDRWRLNRIIRTHFPAISHVTVTDRGDTVLVHVHFITPKGGEVQVYFPKTDRV